PFAKFFESRSSVLPLFPHHRPKSAAQPGFEALKHRGRLTVAEIAEPAPQVGRDLLDHLRKLMPRVRHVCSRIRSLKRTMALGAIRRLGFRSLVKLNPRNFLCPGRATALFAWFTLSLSRCVIKCVTLSITRWPARSLST